MPEEEIESFRQAMERVATLVDEQRDGELMLAIDRLMDEDSRETRFEHLNVILNQYKRWKKR